MDTDSQIKSENPMAINLEYSEFNFCIFVTRT